jgi:hypothetical protein
MAKFTNQAHTQVATLKLLIYELENNSGKPLEACLLHGISIHGTKLHLKQTKVQSLNTFGVYPEQIG